MNCAGARLTSESIVVLARLMSGVRFLTRCIPPFAEKRGATNSLFMAAKGLFIFRPAESFSTQPRLSAGFSFAKTYPDGSTIVSSLFLGAIYEQIE